MRNPARAVVRAAARLLARRGIIDERRGERTARLAWPRMVTGVARLSQQLVDFAMVGAVLGAPALAGLAFAMAYWQMGNTVSLGLSGGTIGQVSQRFGADDLPGVDVAVKQGTWLALLLALPLTVLFVAVPHRLVGLLGGGPTVTAYGAVYLGIVSLGLPFEFANKVASRALVGADDARSPMWVRGTGALVNIVLNTVFIFGMGLGVVGAALGTLLATVFVTAALAWGFLAGRLPGIGAFPFRLSTAGPHYDAGVMRELVSISTPLVARRLAETIFVFPLLSIVATFGPVVVAGFEVARQVRRLINAPNWGFSLAASSLVGQSIGRGDVEEARAYGRDVLRFSVIVFLVVSAAVVVLARPIANVFVHDPATIGRTATFVRVAAVSAVGYGIDGATTGALRGNGDTRWPFYGKLVGLYAVTLPIAVLATATPLGVLALYAALLAETAVPAVVTYYRFWTGAWLPVLRPDATPR